MKISYTTVIIQKLLTISNMYEIEALIEVLAWKGIVSKEEMLEEIKKMRDKSRAY